MARSSSLCALAFCLLIFAAYSGCARKQAETQKARELAQAAPEIELSATAQDFIPPQGEYGTVTQCPVNEEQVMIGAKTPAAKYEGKSYYFCCPLCLSEFKKSPEKYAKKTAVKSQLPEKK